MDGPRRRDEMGFNPAPLFSAFTARSDFTLPSFLRF